MPCCAQGRYGALIVAALDGLAGVICLIIVMLYPKSALVLICLTFPTIILNCLCIVLAIAFLKRNVNFATIAFVLNLTLVIGCGVIIIVLLCTTFRLYMYTPVIIAALFYSIIIQLHFAWVLHDFRTKRYFYNNRKFEYLDNQADCETINA